MKIPTLIFFTTLILLTSCRTTTDTIAYFQDLDATTQTSTPTAYDIRIMPDDQLSINVSGIDPQAVAVFNLPLSSYLAPGEASVVATPMLQTYLVDANGEITFPVLGKIKVEGMTRSQLTEMLTERLNNYVKEPIVTVQIRNFKVSVLGEVNRPGTINVPNERISVLDAIGMAGDLTIYGNRNNVLLIRDCNGKQEFHRFDLTSSDLFNSSYYYLQQNDVLYIEPNKARKGNAKYSQNGQFNISLASTIISAISVLASLTIALLVK
ncbi:MAG: polysaccharide biosynthesis/export family protein [Bacteroides sp.]|nr:polysaccharide biosynthesis/export family protein [Bacteroides sp.]